MNYTTTIKPSDVYPSKKTVVEAIEAWKPFGGYNIIGFRNVCKGEMYVTRDGRVVTSDRAYVLYIPRFIVWPKLHPVNGWWE